MKAGKALHALTLSAAGLLLAIAAVFLAASYLEAWHTPWFEQRLLPTLAVAHGQPIYRMPASGPLIGCTYAPFSYLAYLPAAWMPNLMTTFASGSLLATGFLLLPLGLALRFELRRGLRPIDTGLALLLAFAAIVFLWPLNYVAINACADAPAICLLALSLLPLRHNLQPPRWTLAAGSSLALVLSVACKQNMLLPALVILAAVFFLYGRRFALRYLAFALLWSALAIAITALIYGDLRIVYFNNVTIPAHIPLEKGRALLGLSRLYQYSSGLLLFLAGTSAMLFLTRAGREHEDRPQQTRPCPHRITALFFLLAVVLLPTSIRTFAMVGGDANSFAHALYFLLLGIVLVLSELLISVYTAPRAPAPIRIPAQDWVRLWILAFAFLGLGLSVVDRFDGPRRAILRQPLPAVVAWRFDRQNPGLVYFPSNSVAAFLAERSFYQTDWGILNLTVAGQKLDRQNVLRYVPANAKYFAIPKAFFPPEYLFPFFGPHRIAAQVPGLEDFSVYVLER